MAGLVGLRALRLEWMGAVADPFKRKDHIAGLERAVAPVDRQAAVGEVEARIHNPGNALQSAFDLADAAGAADPLDCKIEVRQAGIAPHEDRKIKRFLHGVAQRRKTRFLERNMRAPSRESSITRAH